MTWLLAIAIAAGAGFLLRRRAVAAGRIINPKTARSQILGGVVMVAGYLLLANLSYGDSQWHLTLAMIVIGLWDKKDLREPARTNRRRAASWGLTLLLGMAGAVTRFLGALTERPS